MSVFDTIRGLKSFKNAKDQPVPRKILGKILEAGRDTPSPGNVQSLQFIVVEDHHKKEMLAEATGDHRLEEAPVDVIVLADMERMARRVEDDKVHDFCNAEAAIAVQNMRLVADEEDIGSCWVTGFDSELVADQFRAPHGVMPLGVVALAYSDSYYRKEDRFDMNSVVFYDEYDNQIASVFDNLEWEGYRENKELVEKKTRGLFYGLKRKLQKFL